MKKVERTSEFIFRIYWWTWKTNNYLKSCWSGPIKNKIISIFTTLHFFKKNKEKHLQIPLSKSWWYDLHFLRYRAKQTEIDNFRSFLPFYSPKNLKNQNFEKWKNLLEMSSFYTCVPEITIMWCTVPEIWSEMDNIFCHFGPFLALSAPWQHDNHMIHGSWDIRCDRQKFCHFGLFFAISAPWQPRKSKF